jgi:hypothetical protein
MKKKKVCFVHRRKKKNTQKDTMGYSISMTNCRPEIILYSSRALRPFSLLFFRLLMVIVGVCVCVCFGF